MSDTSPGHASHAPDGPALDGPVPGNPVPGTLMERMGIVVTEASAERTVATMPVEGNTQPRGLLHGGASGVLVETVGSVAAQRHAGPGRHAVGIELSVTHHRSASSGVVTATATAVHRGGTLVTYEVSVEDASGRRLATGRLTCMVLEARA